MVDAAIRTCAAECVDAQLDHRARDADFQVGFKAAIGYLGSLERQDGTARSVLHVVNPIAAGN
jgi:hypothetical protein